MSDSDTTMPPAGSAYRERNSTADRALDILGMFSESRLSISAADLAAEFRVARSTAYRYLQTLTASGFVEEDPRGGYRLGLRVFELSRLARRSYGLSEVAVPVLQDLAHATGESALLTRRSGDRVVCLEKFDSDAHQVRLTYERGSALPLNAGASAWIVLAWESPELVAELVRASKLTRFTPQSLTERKEISARLERIREDGYAVTHGELDPDVVGVAAPVRDGSGKVVAGISVVSISRRAEGNEEQLIAHVRTAADLVSSRLILAAQ